jgi:hypothetical protein
MVELSGGVVWGWLKPVYEIGANLLVKRGRRAQLLKALDQYHEGRTLEALRLVAGEANSDEGREKTRELLRQLKRGNKHARILKRSDPNDPEMWGLRDR